MWQSSGATLSGWDRLPIIERDREFVIRKASDGRGGYHLYQWRILHPRRYWSWSRCFMTECSRL